MLNADVVLARPGGYSKWARQKQLILVFKTQQLIITSIKAVLRKSAMKVNVGFLCVA